MDPLSMTVSAAHPLHLVEEAKTIEEQDAAARSRRRSDVAGAMIKSDGEVEMNDSIKVVPDLLI